MATPINDGMDVVQVRATAQRIATLGDNVAGVRTTGASLALVLEGSWSGTDSTELLASWDSISLTLDDAAQLLRAMSRQMLVDAEEQDTASGRSAGPSATGGPSASGKSGPSRPGGPTAPDASRGFGGGGPFGGPGPSSDDADGVTDDHRSTGIDKILDRLADSPSGKTNPLAKLLKKIAPGLGIPDAIHDVEEVKKQFWDDGVVNPQEAYRAGSRALAESIGVIPHPAAQALAAAPDLIFDRRDMADKIDNDFLSWWVGESIYMVPQVGPYVRMIDAIPDADIQIVPKDNLPSIRKVRDVGESLPVVGPFIAAGL